MEELKAGTILMGLFGGLALFLYGMEKLTDSLKLLAGDRMRDLLSRMTSNRFKAVASGAIITATIQSSSVTTVLVVGFISAGLLSLSQSIGIIMGAEIGTTITAQIIAFKVTKYSLVAVAAGFLLSMVPKSRQLRLWGAMLMGLGLIFFGMELMKDATTPLRSYAPFIELMQNLRNPALAGAVQRDVHRPRPELVGNHGCHHRPREPGLSQPRGGDRTHLRRQHRYLHHSLPRVDR